jgi:hypothetical protein
MNRQWIYPDNRISSEYISGLHGFLDVAEANKPCVVLLFVHAKCVKVKIRRISHR